MFKSLPTMTADQKTGEAIKDTMQNVKMLVNSALTSNAVMSPVVSFAMQQMYGSVRGIQMQSASSLIAVPIPSHAVTYYVILATISSLDIFKTEKFYEENLPLRKTEPINGFFERNEMETSTFLLCSGPFFIVLMIIIGWHILKNIAYQSTRPFKKCGCCLKLGNKI